MARNLVTNPERFDFDRFIGSIEPLDKAGMILRLQRECKEVEASMDGHKGRQARHDGGFAYLSRLKNLLIWFSLDCKFTVLDMKEVHTCRRLAVRLIGRGELSLSVLPSAPR